MHKWSRRKLEQRLQKRQNGPDSPVNRKTPNYYVSAQPQGRSPSRRCSRMACILFGAGEAATMTAPSCTSLSTSISLIIPAFHSSAPSDGLLCTRFEHPNLHLLRLLSSFASFYPFLSLLSFLAGSGCAPSPLHVRHPLPLPLYSPSLVFPLTSTIDPSCERTFF